MCGTLKSQLLRKYAGNEFVISQNTYHCIHYTNRFQLINDCRPFNYANCDKYEATSANERCTLNVYTVRIVCTASHVYNHLQNCMTIN